MEIEIQAYAKLNLFLLVRGKRADGYHEIDSFFHSISLCDQICLEKSEKLHFFCSLDELDNPQNLAYKALRLFMEATGVKGAKVHLRKNIPLAAGLGGGSSDAAAVLWGLNEIYGRPLKEEKLFTLAEALGADVPFFLFGGACRVRGKGEKITPLKPLKGYEVLLFIFPFTLSTACIYASYKGGEEREPTFEDFLLSLEGKNKVSVKLYNSLESVAKEKFPLIGKVKEKARELGLPVGMSGSGPTVFSLVSNRKEEEDLRKAWSEFKGKIFKTHFVDKGLEVVKRTCKSTQLS